MRPISFDWLNNHVDILDVLEIMGWDWTGYNESNYRGPCPLHGSRSPRSRSFSVSPPLNLFHCFKCGAHGGPIDLWAQHNRLAKLEAAYELCQIFDLEPRYLERWEK